MTASSVSPRLRFLRGAVLVPAVLASLLAAASAQDATFTGQSPATLSITTREVLLDVVVTDASGHPVMGLKPSDFALTEEGAPQRLKSVEEHHAMAAQDQAALKAASALPLNTFSNFTPVANSNAYTVILLDALDTHIDNQMEVRQQVIDYLKHMQPGTPIALFQLDTRMRLIQGFSADPAVLLEAAKSKRDTPSLLKPIRGSQSQYILARNEILRDGLKIMGRYLASFPGRKNLIWFTGSLPTWLNGDSGAVDDVERRAGNPFRDEFTVLDDSATGLTDALTLSRVAVYPIDARQLQSDPGFSAQNRGRPRSSAGFYIAQAVDHMDLDAIAAATGGKAYYNTNRLDRAIAEIVDSGSNYYTLAYATDNQKWDGKYRHIKLSVDRPGVKLHYRPGYYAIDRSRQEQRQLARLAQKKNAPQDAPQTEPAAAQASDQSAPAQSAPGIRPAGGFDASMQPGAVPATEIVFTARVTADGAVVKLAKGSPTPADNFLLASFRDKPFRTYTVSIQMDARTIHTTRTPDGLRHGSVQFVTAVYDQSGQMVNSLETTASFDKPEAHYQKMLEEGFPAVQQLAVPVKGNYFLRIGVHDLGDDHIGTLEIPVDQVQLAAAH